MASVLGRHAGAGTLFLVLYWILPDLAEPVLLLDIRIGGRNRFRWSEQA